jgi:divalent metal cation (Fe/Co/Zn/Cd) transporter
VLFCYFSINLSKDFRRDREFNYGYTRFTVVATFINTIYILFEFLELIHELTEGLSEHEEEDNPHDADEYYLFYGTRILCIKIALLLVLFLWTLKDVSLLNKIEDILERNFPAYERFVTDEDDVAAGTVQSDKTLKN